MDFFKDITKSLLFTILSVYWTVILTATSVIDLNRFILDFSYTFKNTIYLGLLIFCTLLCVVSSITFIIKAIYHLIRGMYYGFFYNNNFDKMEIKIDEENRIQESYIEFKNGTILPISISRIVTQMPPTTEEKENE